MRGKLVGRRQKRRLDAVAVQSLSVRSRGRRMQAAVWARRLCRVRQGVPPLHPIVEQTSRLLFSGSMRHCSGCGQSALSMQSFVQTSNSETQTSSPVQSRPLLRLSHAHESSRVYEPRLERGGTLPCGTSGPAGRLLSILNARTPEHFATGRRNGLPAGPLVPRGRVPPRSSRGSLARPPSLQLERTLRLEPWRPFRGPLYGELGGCRVPWISAALSTALRKAARASGGAETIA